MATIVVDSNDYYVSSVQTMGGIMRVILRVRGNGIHYWPSLELVSENWNDTNFHVIRDGSNHTQHATIADCQQHIDNIASQNNYRLIPHVRYC